MDGYYTLPYIKDQALNVFQYWLPPAERQWQISSACMVNMLLRKILITPSDKYFWKKLSNFEIREGISLRAKECGVSSIYICP